MAVALDDAELGCLRTKLRQGEYDGVDIMHACLALDELRELRSWREKAFVAHPNIDLDIEAIGDWCITRNQLDRRMKAGLK